MKILLKVLSFAKNLWGYYLGVTVFSVLVALSGLAVPFIIKLATDSIQSGIVTHHINIDYVIWLAVWLLIADVAGTLFSNWGGYLGDVMAAKLKMQLSDKYYEHLLRLPQQYYDQELTGTIINRLNRTITEVTQFINMFANNFFQMYLTLFLILGICLWYSWELAGLMFIVYPIFMWLTAVTSKKWQTYQAEKNLETDIASGRFAEVIAQIRVVKSFVQERLEYKHFTDRMQKTVDITFDQSKYWHEMDILRRIVLNVVFFAVIAYIFTQTANGRFSIGVMFLLIQLVNMARIPIFSMSFVVDNTQKAIAGSRDYFAVMELEPAVSDKPKAKDLVVDKGKIEYKNITFSYDENNKDIVLENISFKIKPGEKIAFVGESGEGKTTLTSLLLRLYDPDSGEILIDKTPINKIKQKSLRDNIAVVFQEPALFSGTIRENIIYGDNGASEQEVLRAVKFSNSYEFIDKLEKGLDTEIGERGLKLSGGQKQRIAIARAILKDSPVLILDEATSSLDSKSERLVQSALDHLMKNRTTLIIAHRLSTIAHVDRIITIKKGKIDEIGTPEKLAKSGGIYAQLLELQTATAESAKKRLKGYEIVG